MSNDDLLGFGLEGISGEPPSEEVQEAMDLFSGEEFRSELQDEYGFDSHPPPGIELLGASELPEQQAPLSLQIDRGSGSAAEDGRREILEDQMDNGTVLGSAAMYGPTEIGASFEDDLMGRHDLIGRHEEDYEIGSGAAADRPGSEIGYGPYSQRGASEIGNSGYIAKHGPSEIGNSGYIARDGASEIGYGPFSERGASEIGRHRPDLQRPFESFMLDDYRMGGEGLGFGGFDDEIGRHEEDYEIGRHEEDYAIGAGAAADRPGSEIGFGGFDQEIGSYAMYGPTEIGAAAAVAKVVEKARDNRQPAPPMKAVHVDDPFPADDDWGLTDVVIGAAVAAPAGVDPFPLLSKLLLRAGAATEPRIVRVDTEESYKNFRAENSPELQALHAKIDAHISDQGMHTIESDTNLPADLTDDIEDLVLLGAEADAAEAEKRVDLWMPKRFDGKVEAWREGKFVCVSMALPGQDGEVRICTSLEPMSKCIEEMTRHASEAQVPVAAVVGALPAMGCVLGAGTVIKEIAAAAPSILQQPDTARKTPFMVRIQPKTSPTLAALAMLAYACSKGDAQACDEWQRLGVTCPGSVRQAMVEALALCKAAT